MTNSDSSDDQAMQYSSMINDVTSIHTLSSSCSKKGYNFRSIELLFDEEGR